VVGEDSGAITLMRMTTPMSGTGPPGILHLGSSFTHNGMVSSVSVLPDKQKIVTSSYDLSIKIINTNGLIVEHEFMPAHGHPVLSVATQTNSETFASCADSTEVLLWDSRLEKPAHSNLNFYFFGLKIFNFVFAVIYENGINNTCVNWQPEGHILAIGDQSGVVSLVDARTPKTLLSKFNAPAHRPLHRILFNPKK
jgi:WD40 repeat protein